MGRVIIFSALVGFLFLPFFALAQNGLPSRAPGIDSRIDSRDPLLPGGGVGPQSLPGVPGPIITSKSQIASLIVTIVNFIAGLLFVIAAGMLIFAAILYLTAGGSEGRVGRAKNYLIYAIIGIVVGVLALSVEPFIENFFRGQ